MLMIAKQVHTSGGKRRRVGDEFDVARKQDARLLVALGFAERKQETTQAVPVVAPVVPRETLRARKSDSKRSYRRRDMVAE